MSNVRRNVKVPHVGIKTVGPTALSGTTDVLLGGAALELPEDAKSILGVIPILSSPAGNTAGEPIVAELWLTSEDYKVNPYHVLAQPIGSSLLKSVGQLQGPLSGVKYPVNCCDPKVGGGNLKCYGKAFFDHTIEPYMACAVIFGDFYPTDPITNVRRPQHFAKVGTYTDTGTSAAEVAGSGISIVGGRVLKEVCGYAVGTTVAALKGILGKIRLSSDGFTPSWNLVYPINPISGQVDTNIQEAVAGVARFPEVNMEMKSKLTINDYFTLAVALTTTGDWIVGVLYV